MIEQLTDMPEGAIGFRGSGKLTSRDYHDTLLPAIRAGARERTHRESAVRDRA